MPKKKKKTKKRSSKKRKVKKSKRISRRRKIIKKSSKRKKSIKLEKIKDTTSQELVFKTKPEWIKSSLASKSLFSCCL